MSNPTNTHHISNINPIANTQPILLHCHNNVTLKKEKRILRLIYIKLPFGNHDYITNLTLNNVSSETCYLFPRCQPK